MAGRLVGELTLHGVTRPITIAVSHIGAGFDPGAATGRSSKAAPLTLADFGILRNLGPASKRSTCGWASRASAKSDPPAGIPLSQGEGRE